MKKYVAFLEIEIVSLNDVFVNLCTEFTDRIVLFMKDGIASRLSVYPQSISQYYDYFTAVSKVVQYLIPCDSILHNP